MTTHLSAVRVQSAIVIVLGMLLLLPEDAAACRRRCRSGGGASVYYSSPPYQLRSLQSGTIFGQQVDGTTDHPGVALSSVGTSPVLDDNRVLKFVLDVNPVHTPGSSLAFSGVHIAAYAHDATPDEFPPAGSSVGTLTITLNQYSRYDVSFTNAETLFPTNKKYKIAIWAQYGTGDEKALSRSVGVIELKPNP
jgi:hypothetical protein